MFEKAQSELLIFRSVEGLVVSAALQPQGDDGSLSSGDLFFMIFEHHSVRNFSIRSFGSMLFMIHVWLMYALHLSQEIHTIRES